jgi:methionyl-tRNA formyltransferase
VGDGMVSWALLYGCSWAEPAVVEAARQGASIIRCQCTDTDQCAGFDYEALDRLGFELVVTVAWRHIVPDYILAVPRGVIGFHSAKLPEHPGRAPVPWTLLRGDSHAYMTMLYLTDEPDAGDIVAEWSWPIKERSAAALNVSMGYAAGLLLKDRLPAVLAGHAPRQPQDRSKRGPLTKANGWQLLPEDRR